MGEHKAQLDCAPHLQVLINPAKLAKRVRQCRAALKKYDYDTIAVRGVSGLLIGPALAIACRKQLIVVRKGEQTHSMQTCEGNAGTERYVIVDDFIDTGHTVNIIQQEIKNWQIKRHGNAGVCIGVLESANFCTGEKVSSCSDKALNTAYCDDVPDEEEL